MSTPEPMSFEALQAAYANQQARLEMLESRALALESEKQAIERRSEARHEENLRLQQFIAASASADAHLIPMMASLLTPATVSTGMMTEDEYFSVQLQCGVSQVVSKCASLEALKCKEESQRMAAEERVKSMQRELDCMRKKADVQAENSRKEMEGTNRRLEELARAVGERDATIGALHGELKARLSVEKSKSVEFKMERVLSHNIALMALVKEKDAALEKIRSDMLEWREVSFLELFVSFLVDSKAISLA